MTRVDKLKIGNNEYELRGSQINNLQTTINNLQNTVNNLSSRTNFLENNLIGSIQLTLLEKYGNDCYITVQTTNVSNKNNIRYYTIYGTTNNRIVLDITSFVKYVLDDNNNFRIQVSTKILSSDDFDNFNWTNNKYNIYGEVTDNFGNSISSNILLINSYNTYTENSFNGHAYVDLGLPSGTLWATMNIGANSITNYGNYYMYGTGSRTYHGNDTPYTGTETPLDLSKDTANVVWGGDWHMPSLKQMEELRHNTTYAWTTNYNGSGINGSLFTSSNGKSVFFPAGGRYYTGSLSYVGSEGYYCSSSCQASDVVWQFNLDNNYPSIYTRPGTMGFSVRGVVG